MAAIAASQVSEVKGYTRYDGGDRPRNFISKRLTITGVTAGDTATAAVLQVGQVLESHSAIYIGTPNVPVLVGTDVMANGIIIGAGPANATVHVTVVGTPTLLRGY